MRYAMDTEQGSGDEREACQRIKHGVELVLRPAMDLRGRRLVSSRRDEKGFLTLDLDIGAFGQERSESETERVGRYGIWLDAQYPFIPTPTSTHLVDKIKTAVSASASDRLEKAMRRRDAGVGARGFVFLRQPSHFSRAALI